MPLSLKRPDKERNWPAQTVLPGYVGSGYVSAWPDTDLEITTGPELEYTVNVTTTGTYYLWVRGYAPNSAGDSVYISLDNQSVASLSGFSPQAWSWTNNDMQGSPVTIEVSQPGLHTLHLWQREDGLRLDRIILTTDSSYNPTGDGPSESEIR